MTGYLISAALAAAVASAGVASYMGDRHKAELDGIRLEYATAQIDAQREQTRETARLIGLTRKAQDDYIAQGERLRQFGVRADRLARLREQDRAAFGPAVERASADSLRRYAQASRDNFDRSRAELDRFGREAVACAAAAHALKASVEALSQPAE